MSRIDTNSKTNFHISLIEAGYWVDFELCAMTAKNSASWSKNSLRLFPFLVRACEV